MHVPWWQLRGVLHGIGHLPLKMQNLANDCKWNEELSLGQA